MQVNRLTRWGRLPARGVASGRPARRRDRQKSGGGGPVDGHRGDPGNKRRCSGAS